MIHNLGKLFAIASSGLVAVVALCAWANIVFSGVAKSAADEVRRIETLLVQAEHAAVLAHESLLPDGMVNLASTRLALDETSLYFSEQAGQRFQPSGIAARWLYAQTSSTGRADAYENLRKRLKLLARSTDNLARAESDVDRAFGVSAIRAQTRSDLSIDLNYLVNWHAEVLTRSVSLVRTAQIVAVPLVLTTLLAIWAFLVQPLQRRESAARERLRERERETRKLALVARHANDAITLMDPSGRIEWLNDAHERNLGCDASVYVGNGFCDMMKARGCQVHGASAEELDHAVTHGEPFLAELENTAADGSPFWTELELIPVAGEGGSAPQLIAIERNVTERKRDMERIQQANAAVSHRALHDTLTDLPNRQFLSDHLNAALSDADGPGQIGVLQIDLDRFKQINDTLGHAAGDHVLKHAARQIRNALRENDFLARVGGDEFIAVCRMRNGPADIETIGARVIDRVAESTLFEGQECSVGASVGFATNDADRATSDALIAAADVALYEAKRSGRGVIRMFNAALGTAHRDRQFLMTDVGRAVSRREFEPYFQPQIDMANNRLLGFELLARWQHPEEGLKHPEGFLSAARESGLISDIDDMVLTKGLSALADLRAQGLMIPKVSANISARTLRDPVLVDRLSMLLDRHNLGTRDLALEVQEEAIIADDDDPAIQNIEALHRSGYAVWLDDFGAGHAAMSKLIALNLSGIKLDRSLVAPLPGASGQAIVRAILSLCYELSMHVIAAGVERKAQADILLDLGCKHAQGFGIGRPMPVSEIPAWIEGFDAVGDSNRVTPEFPNIARSNHSVAI